jgi:hypothetical protein
MKNLSIEIGSVAVDGLAGGVRNGEAMGRGIERALGRILESQGLPQGLSPRDVARISLPNLRLPANATDGQIAEAVAATLHRMLGGRR